MIKNAIFDLDDTLILCNEYYREIIDKAAAHITVHTELDNRVAKDLIIAINNVSITLPNGFNRERFPTTLQAAYSAACAMTATRVDANEMQYLHALGDSVFDKPYDILPGAIMALEEASKHWTLFLWTKGDPSVQSEKIRKHDLFSYFAPTHCHIIPQKTKYELLNLCLEHKMNPTETLMIGDSVPDDIQSAQQLDMPYIHIRNYPMPYWENTVEDEHTIKTENLAAILAEIAEKKPIYNMELLLDT